MPGGRDPLPRLVARLRRARPVERFLTRPAVERQVALMKRSGVLARERWRFVARELLGRRELRGYRVRGAPMPVLVRHGTADVATLDDVFLTLDYELPAAVAAQLAALGRPAEVLDLGANVGYFGAFILGRLPDVRLTGFEPDPSNVETLRRAVAISGWGRHWTVVDAAADVRDGTVSFAAGRESTSHVLANAETVPDAREVRAVDVLPLLAEADLVKVDIEGGEWPILCDERFATVAPAAIVVEYHPERCPDADPHEAAPRLLREAGYQVATTVRRSGGQGVVWGWREPDQRR